MKAILKTRILLLNYNGIDLMKECLPSIMEAARRSRRKVTVTVIDNVSRDGSVAFLKNAFPAVHIIEAGENRILCSYNDALKVLDEDVVILLNNDIKVDPSFIDPLLDPFEKDPDVFSVGCKCLDFNGQGFQGEKSIGGIKWGMFWTNSRYAGHEKDMQNLSWTVQVALGAFDRQKFNLLGGYDDLYLPGTWEDTDISLRAYRNGWHCLYEPRSVIYHKGQATFHKVHGKSGSRIIANRNSFLFLWKNFQSLPFLIQHFLFLPLRLIASLLKRDMEWILGLVSAFKKMKAAFAKGKKELSKPQKRSDQDILFIFSQRSYKASI